MRISTFSRATLAVAVSVLGASTDPTQAIQLANGTVSFDKSPRLMDAATTFNTIRTWGATYYFTVNLPEDAGEPLQRVTIGQRQGQDTIRFQLKDSTAFEGTSGRKGKKLTIKEVTKEPETGAISVTFDPPIPPGRTFTIGLDPVRNPDSSGVYLFGVTAFPAGEKPYGLYLGVGRLHFYDVGPD